MRNATLDLIDKRLRHRLDIINGKRMVKDVEEVRFDIDIPEEGYLGIKERTYYHVRSEMRFQPLLTILVTYRQNVYYFDVRDSEGNGPNINTEIYKALKHPPNRNEERNETFWLSTELDVPLAAIEKHMQETLI